MEAQTEQVDTIAGCLFRREWSADVLARAKDLVERRYSDPLVMALMGLTGEEQYDSMTAVMALLESLANIDFALAGALMIPLYDRAGVALVHEVNDAIDLWMYENRSPALAAHIRKMAPEVEDMALRRHYLQWVETLDLPAGNA